MWLFFQKTERLIKVSIAFQTAIKTKWSFLQYNELSSNTASAYVWSSMEHVFVHSLGSLSPWW